MSARRSQCPLAFALDRVGDRWSLLVLRDLLLFDKRTFGELAASPEGIATNVLTARLDQLCATGMIEKARVPDDARRFVYKPTRQALSVLPVLHALARWSIAIEPSLRRGKPEAWLVAYERDPEAWTEALARKLSV